MMNNLKKLSKSLLTFILTVTAILTGSGIIPQSIDIVAADSIGNIYYIDSQNGNDKNSGLSEGKAWKTLEKVNSMTFEAGDSIRFKAGTIYDGQLWPKGNGRQGSEITVGSYGEGERPIINGGGISAPAVKLHNQEYWIIDNLEVTNDDDFGVDQEDNGGIIGIGVTGQNVGELHGITIRNCYVHDVDSKHVKDGAAAIVVEVQKGSEQTWFNGILIENNFIENVDRTGISTRSQYTTTNRSVWVPHKNVKVQKNVVKDIAGDGIVITAAESPLLEYNTAVHCCTKTQAANAAIWVYATNNAVMQYNEAYDTVPGGADKQGFDIDHCTTNTTVQYNYSHNNGGGFLLICCPKNGINGGNIVRYNISQNDMEDSFRINGRIGYIDKDKNEKESYIYNNTIYVREGLSVRSVGLFDWDGYIGGNLKFYNNIFANEGGGKAIYYPSWANPTPMPEFKYNLWQTSDTASIPKGEGNITGDPRFIRKGEAKAGRDTAACYKLKDGSPCIDKGMTIENNGGHDFFGNGLYYIWPDKKADIGAHEFTSFDYKIPDDIENSAYKDAIINMNYWYDSYKDYTNDNNNRHKYFEPTKQVSVSEFVTALVKTTGLNSFNKDTAAEASIDTAKNFGILGRSDAENTSKTLTLKEAVSWALNLALKNSGTEKETDVLVQAKRMGILTKLDTLGGDTGMTREITAQLLYNLVESKSEYYNLNKKGLKPYDTPRKLCKNFDPGEGTVLKPTDNAMTRSGKYSSVCMSSDTSDFINARSALNTEGGKDFNVNGYLKYDLSKLKYVNKATLRLYSDILYSDNNFGTLSIYDVENDSWEGKTITWANAPAAGEQPISRSEQVKTPYLYYDIDVTDIVKREFKGDKMLSLMFSGSDNDDVVLTIGSMTFSNYPQLVVDENEVYFDIKYKDSELKNLSQITPNDGVINIDVNINDKTVLSDLTMFAAAYKDGILINLKIIDPTEDGKFKTEFDIDGADTVAAYAWNTKTLTPYKFKKIQ